MAARSVAGSPCCISHAFLAAATTYPDNIALIHAAGGAKLCSLSRSAPATAADAYHPGDSSGGADDEECLSESMRLPLYEGDVCFTFSDVLSAVESLSRRIRRVLDGGDDPHLLSPKGSCFSSNDQNFIFLLKHFYLNC